jgi:hypothetical protein
MHPAIHSPHYQEGFVVTSGLVGGGAWGRRRGGRRRTVRRILVQDRKRGRIWSAGITVIATDKIGTGEDK